MHITVQEVQRQTVYKWAQEMMKRSADGYRVPVPFDLLVMIYNVSHWCEPQTAEKKQRRAASKVA